MSKKFVYTCYGCKHYYSDKGEKYPRKHCGIVDHWNNCKQWKPFRKEKEMAIARKCDICGALYESYNVKDSKKNPNGFKLLNIDDNGRFYSHDNIDCCPNCMKYIMDHINTLKENKKND